MMPIYNPLVDGLWAKVDYDVHRGASMTDSQLHGIYDVIYAYLRPRSLRGTDSTMFIKSTMAHLIPLLNAQINSDLSAKGFPCVELYVEFLSPSMDKLSESRVTAKLSAKVQEIGDTLEKKIVKLSAEIDGVAADVNALLRKGGLALSYARREVEKARALAVAFGLTEMVAYAFSATDAAIKAEAHKRLLVKATRSVLAVKAAAQGLELIEELDG